MTKFFHRLLHDQGGYSLVIIAALFAAFAVAVGAYIDHNVAVQQVLREQDTRDKLSRLSSAIIQYRYYNGRYPCPAAKNVAYNDVTFGKMFEYTSTGCDKVASGSPGGAAIDGVLVNDSAVATQIVRGMVPVRDLVQYGVDLTDAFDSWNGRIMYTVNRRMTPSVSAAATDAPVVRQVTVKTTLPTVDFVLVSYGRDRIGSILRSQTSPTTGCGAGTALRDENCDGDFNFAMASTYTPSSATTANYYDDIVSVGTRPQACLADGISSGGNAMNCCNGDDDSNGVCGTASGACASPTWVEHMNNYDDIGCVIGSNTCSPASPSGQACSSANSTCVIKTCGPGNFGRTTIKYKCTCS